MKPFFERYIRPGTDDVPLARLLAPFGVKYSDARKAETPAGRQPERDGNDMDWRRCTRAAPPTWQACRRATCWWPSASLRVTGNPANLDTLLGRYAVGAKVAIPAPPRRTDDVCGRAGATAYQGVNGPAAGAPKKATGPKRPSAA